MISGANRGIGLAIARALYEEENYLLSLGVRDINNENLKTSFPDKERVFISQYDARNSETAGLWVKNTLEVFGSIDGLVNNAGVYQACGIENFDEENLDDVWLVNTKAPILLTKLAWEHLKKSGHGRIINIASIAGKITRPEDFGYALSKHAILAFTHSVRQAGWEHGIRTTAICPGWVNTDMASGAGDFCELSTEEMIQPEDIGELVKTLMSLPNTASISELVVNPQCSPLF